MFVLFKEAHFSADQLPVTPRCASRGNYQHLRDLLAEREGLVLSRASVRRILLPAGIASSKTQRRRQHRRRCTRSAQEGMLVQIDGSRHAWLEERGPQLTLIAAIDDATGKLAAAVVRHEEDAAGYFLLVPRDAQRASLASTQARRIGEAGAETARF